MSSRRPQWTAPNVGTCLKTQENCVDMNCVQRQLGLPASNKHPFLKKLVSVGLSCHFLWLPLRLCGETGRTPQADLDPLAIL